MSEQILKDKHGYIIGKIIERNDGILELQNKFGHTIGKYNPKTNRTIDKHGHEIGQGNLLTTLLKE